MKKKSVIIGSSILVILFLIGGGFIAYQQHTKKIKEAVVESFITNFEKKDFTNLAKSLSTESIKKADLNQDELIKKYESIFTGLNLTNIKGTLNSFDNDTFNLSFNIGTPFGNLDKLAYEGKIVKEDGNYKIDWNYSLIFPTMKKGDKVYMTNDEPVRGDIVDINNLPLATTHEYPQYGIVPNKLGDGDEKKQAIEKISKAFDLSLEDINNDLKQSWVKEDSFVPIKTVDFDSPVDIDNLVGVQSTSVVKRYYPLKEATAQLIGYVGTTTAEEIEKDSELSGFTSTGKTGLEAQLDKELRGKQGGKIEIVNENDEPVKTLIEQEKQDGKKIQLTIDSTIQKNAFDALESKAGATVVTEPTTGQLKAVVSSPSYNPNEFVLGVSQKEYESYEKNADKPFNSRFATGFAPGSTFKTITAAIGIDNNITTVDKTRQIDGLKWQKDSSWGDYFVTRVSDVPSVSMNDALIYSDNIYFAQEALEIGKDKYVAGLKKFPFDEKMNVDIAMTPAQISNDGIDSDILLADTSYGQGQLLINPIQQAVMYSAFANNGNIVMPKIIPETETKTKEGVISQNASTLVKNALLLTVEDDNGTAHILNSDNNTIAAKTGTAEIKEKQDTKGKENSFILAFDTENSKYLVVSMLENADGTSAVSQNKDFILTLMAN